MVAPTPKKGAKTPAPTPPAKPSRRKVDWEAVERDYRTGKFTLRELADKHKANYSLIGRNAREKGWTQDLAIAIKQATNAALVDELVGAEVHSSTQKVHSVIQAAAETNKNVILGHRTDIKNLRDLTAGLMSELAQSALAAAEQDELAALLATLQDGKPPTGKQLERSQALVRKALELPGRIASAKALAETFTRLQLLERTAFGLDEKSQPEDPGGNGGKSLTDVERAVRIVHFLNRGGQQS